MFPSRNSKLLGKQNVFPECRNGNLTFLIEPRCRTRPESEIYRCIKLNGDKRFRIRLLLRRVEELLPLLLLINSLGAKVVYERVFRNPSVDGATLRPSLQPSGTKADKDFVKTMGIPQKSLSLKTTASVTIPWTITGYQR